MNESILEWFISNKAQIQWALRAYDIYAIWIGLLFSLIFGSKLIGLILRIIGNEKALPKRPGYILGRLEHIFFYFAILADKPEGIFAWMTIKVASKWNIWRLRVNEFPFESPRLSLVLMRFLVGSICNILFAYLGVSIHSAILILKVPLTYQIFFVFLLLIWLVVTVNSSLADKEP